jgi:hypothetical protein
MTELWTHATFTVKPGREREFADAWIALARRARDEFDANPTLLRDRERPNVFLGFGSWPDVDTMQRFRSATADRGAALDELLEHGDAIVCERLFP